MTRIEEIKERLELLQNAQTIKQANIQKVWLEEHVLSNTKNLLSRLEIAEAALEFYEEKRNYYIRNVLPCSDTEGTEHPIMDDEGGIARTALQQIRS